jgi:hypothetical protein
MNYVRSHSAGSGHRHCGRRDRYSRPVYRQDRAAHRRGCSTVDSNRNLSSLDALAKTGARTVLVGHGEPWREGAEAAVSLAREAGTS